MKPTNLREAEHYRSVWHVELDAGETLQNALQPTFWAHVARRLRPLAEIVIYAHDFSWRATLLVRSATPLEARVVLLDHIDLDEAEKAARSTAPDDTRVVAWKGPSAKHCVIRAGDKMVIESGFETKADAEAWIKNPIPRTAAAA